MYSQFEKSQEHKVVNNKVPLPLSIILKEAIHLIHVPVHSFRVIINVN